MAETIIWNNNYSLVFKKSPNLRINNCQREKIFILKLAISAEKGIELLESR